MKTCPAYEIGTAALMHREISHSDKPFHTETPLSLYLITGIVGLLLAADLGAGLWESFVGWIGAESWLPTWSNKLFDYRLALLAAVLGGARTLYGSLESLVEGRLGADLAVAIAAIAAILIGEPVVAAEVVFIGMIGEVLESFTFARTQRAIRKLAEIRPRRCWLLKAGQEERIFVKDLQIGDRVVVKPGARIPADGVVVEGSSTLDVSALTGESLPVEKGPADEVLAGSLNQHGALTIDCQRVAEQTVVGRVLEMTAEALQKKGDQERTADRLARYFLPVVLGLASITFLVVLLYHAGPFSSAAPETKLPLAEAVRLATYPALSILVVACPCALILATPAAVIAALGRLAGTGVLIKSGAALEKLALVDAFAFDKTGTITEGKLELGDVLPLEGESPDEIIRLAAIAEQRSEHVLAELILREARQRDLSLEALEEFQAHPGSGVVARTASCSITVGTRKLMQEQNVSLSREVEQHLQQLDETGQTALLVARDSQILGALGARDRVRREAADTITELRNLGMEVMLLTGDREAAARTVAEGLGITNVHAELLPHEKAEYLKTWQEPRPLTPDSRPLTPDSRHVAMVGDGINDAPALAQADVGIAIGSGTDIAAEAGDVVFMGDPLLPLPLLVRLSRQTAKIIRQNIIIFAFAVNFVGIVVTAWLWPMLAPPGTYEQSPVVAVIYHQLGSLLVLLNAMRLLWFERSTDNPRWLSWKKRFGGVNDWLERNLNLDEWLYGLGHHWKKAVAICLTLALIVYLLTGITTVAADEVGVVQRFGRALDKDLEPGFYLRWPWPIERVTKLKPDAARTVEVGFRPMEQQQSKTEDAGWSSGHGQLVLRRPEEAIMITGDDNLIEVQATIRYRIDRERLRSYLFEVKDPHETLRSLAEAVIRQVVASRELNLLLTGERKKAQEEIRLQLSQRCRATGANGLGVKIDSVALQELHPPPEVVGAYHEVARALEKKRQLENLARRDAMLRLQQADSEAERDRSDALLYAERVKKLAEADLHVFRRRWNARNELTLSQELQLLGDWLQNDAALGMEVATVATYEEKRRLLVQLQAQASIDRLRWEVLEASLKRRKKVIVDADAPWPFYLFSLDRLRNALPPPAMQR